MKEITSPSNPEIKRVASLHQKKYRDQHKQFIAQGLRTCTAFLQANFKPVAVFVTYALEQEIGHIIKNEKIISVVTPEVLKKISTLSAPSGVVMVFKKPLNAAPEKLTAGIVLARITNPGNMGTLIRSALAFGCKSIAVVEGTDPWSPKVVQASAGTIARARIFNLSWDELLKHKQQLQLCAMVVKDGTPPNELTFSESLIVVGNEAHGLPKEWVNDCQQKVTLPMSSQTESLNAAVAGSILLYIAFAQ